MVKGRRLRVVVCELIEYVLIGVAHYKFFRGLISLAIAIVHSSHFLFFQCVWKCDSVSQSPLDQLQLRAARSRLERLYG